MEPGRDDREELPDRDVVCTKKGEPLWSPVVTTGKSVCGNRRPRWMYGAAMEPGRDDREEPLAAFAAGYAKTRPLWSPVVTTGKRPDPTMLMKNITPSRYGARS